MKNLETLAFLFAAIVVTLILSAIFGDGQERDDW